MGTRPIRGVDPAAETGLLWQHPGLIRRDKNSARGRSLLAQLGLGQARVRAARADSSRR